MSYSAVEELKRVIALKERELENLKQSLAVLEKMNGGSPGTVELADGITVPKGGKRRKFSDEFKRRVLAEISSGTKMQDILDRYGLYASHISSWRKQLAKEGPNVGFPSPGEGSV